MFTKRHILNSLAGGAAALLVLTIIAWWLAGLTPHWYAPPALNDEAAQVLGETAEYRLVEEFQKIRPTGEVWRLRIPTNAINAWLATRLPAWLEGRGQTWPNDLGTPQIHIHAGRITLAAPAAALGDRTGRLVVQPRVEDDLLQCAVSAGLGRWPIAVPARLLTQHLPTAVTGDGALASLTSLASGNPIAARIPLVDGRSVDIRDIRIEPGAVVVTAITRPGEGGSRD